MIIYHDKIAFIPRIKGLFNIQKSVDGVEHIDMGSEIS